MCGINCGPAECRVIVNSLLHTYRHFRIQGMLHVLRDACPGFYEELETMVRNLEAVAARPAKSVGVGEAAMHDPLCRGQKPTSPRLHRKHL
jgi:hypothetical protein